jgi:tetratricopeptide (TPR) repeat protein
MTATFLVLMAVPSSQNPVPPTYADVRALFDAGKYAEVVQMASANADGMKQPRVRYLTARALEKLGDVAKARGEYAALAARDEGDPWRSIGESAGQLLEPETSEGQPPKAARYMEALATATKGTELARDLPDAQFQLGLAASHAGGTFSPPAPVRAPRPPAIQPRPVARAIPFVPAATAARAQ